MSRKPIPRCQACCRIETAGGWTEGPTSLSPGSPGAVYETLCRDCLASWTSDLLAELDSLRHNKDQAA